MRSAADIVIPMHGRADLLTTCLTALDRGNGGAIETVYVVDDASPEDEASRARASCAGRRIRVEWLRLHARSGFLSAAMAGWAASNRPITIVMNSDTVPAPGAIAALCDILDREADIAAVAPVSDNPRDLFQYRRGAHPVAAPCEEGGVAAAPGGGFMAAEYLTAMCLAIRRAAVGAQLFDTTYSPGYFEDLDLCCRLRTSGWRLAIAEQAFVHHLGGATFGEGAEWTSLVTGNYGRFTARWGWLPSHAALDEALASAGLLEMAL